MIEREKPIFFIFYFMCECITTFTRVYAPVNQTRRTRPCRDVSKTVSIFSVVQLVALQFDKRQFCIKFQTGFSLFRFIVEHDDEDGDRLALLDQR